MFKFKKENLPTTLFVAGSISALILFFLLSVALSFVLFDSGGSSNANSRIANESDKYFLNENYREDDPYITKNPDLSDMLSGPIISSQDPDIGEKNAPVVIVQFSDFECDFCLEQEEVLKNIKEKYGNNLRIIWKDYPESDRSSLSYLAASASRCAQDQGKFWEYHDFLFKNNKNLSEEMFYNGAENLDLDLDVFEDCLENSENREKIDDNIIEANALGISGVPFLFINDQEIMGSISEEELEKVISAELEKNE